MSHARLTRRSLLKKSLLLGAGAAAGLAGSLSGQTPATPPSSPSTPPLPPPSYHLQSGLYETLFLTWAGDPCTTMRVQWLETVTDAPAPVVIAARSELDGTRHEARTRCHPFGRRRDVWVQRVDFTGLRPDTSYVLDLPGRREAAPRFLTAPAKLERPLTFIEGGDINVVPEALLMHAVALREDPLFAVVGGDLAYSDGKDANINGEIRFYCDWGAGMVTPDRRLIPLIPAIGNHEVTGYYGKTRAEAPYFFSLFDTWAHPEIGAYRALDFGDYLSLLLLDTDHTCPVAAQNAWLGEALAARAQVPHVFPVYHVPAYPSVRRYDDRINLEVRRHWVPLFEASPQVRVAFEHHDHAFKRTHPLRAGAPDATDGVTYLGDGSWGLARRPLRQTDTEVFLHREEKFHVWRVTLTPGEQRFLALDERGKHLDAWSRPLARA